MTEIAKMYLAPTQALAPKMDGMVTTLDHDHMYLHLALARDSQTLVELMF